MGWVPEHKRGVSEEPQPAPRRRRRAGAPDLLEETGAAGGHGARRRRRATAEAVAMMPDREERVVTTRPAPGQRGAANDSRSRDVKVHLGKRWAQIVREIRAGAYTWQQFAEGLSADELARGQLKDSHGGFSGRPPTIVPREFHLACFRELKRRFDEQFQSSVLAIAEQYVELAKDKEIPAKDRARMMQYAMERVFGGIPKEVLVKQDAPWEEVVTSIVANEGDPAPEWRKNRYATYDKDREEEGSDDD